MSASQIFVVLAAALSGCTTLGPLQTASTVAPGRYRASAELSHVTWCTVGVAFDRCAVIPSGLPGPELRLNVRHGIVEGLDVGASLSGSLVIGFSEGAGLQSGLLLDGKKELWSNEIGPNRRQIFSLGAAAGVVGQVSTAAPAGLTRVDLGIPAFFGHQTESLEWVVGARFFERLSLVRSRDSTRRDIVPTPWAGVSGGFFTRTRTQFGIQFSYETPVSTPRLLMNGLFTVSTGLAFDFGPEPSVGQPTNSGLPASR